MKKANLFQVQNENGQILALFQCTNYSVEREWILQQIENYYNPSHPAWRNIKELEYFGIIEATKTIIKLRA